MSVDYRSWKPGLQAMHRLQAAVHESGLDRRLLELVKVRASQVNGCAYCIDMHTKDARALGESEQRLYALSAWRKTPFFSDRERAALTLAEAVSRLDETRVPDTVVDAAREQFSDEELTALLYGIVLINGWNMLCVTGQPEVGSYQPAAASADGGGR